jgi:hypothetical protein
MDILLLPVNMSQSIPGLDLGGHEFDALGKVLLCLLGVLWIEIQALAPEEEHVRLLLLVLDQINGLSVEKRHCLIHHGLNLLLAILAEVASVDQVELLNDLSDFFCDVFFYSYNFNGAKNLPLLSMEAWLIS